MHYLCQYTYVYVTIFGQYLFKCYANFDTICRKQMFVWLFVGHENFGWFCWIKPNILKAFSAASIRFTCSKTISGKMQYHTIYWIYHATFGVATNFLDRFFFNSNNWPFWTKHPHCVGAVKIRHSLFQINKSAQNFGLRKYSKKEHKATQWN